MQCPVFHCILKEVITPGCVRSTRGLRQKAHIYLSIKTGTSLPSSRHLTQLFSFQWSVPCSPCLKLQPPTTTSNASYPLSCFIFFLSIYPYLRDYHVLLNCLLYCLSPLLHCKFHENRNFCLYSQDLEHSNHSITIYRKEGRKEEKKGGRKKSFLPSQNSGPHGPQDHPRVVIYLWHLSPLCLPVMASRAWLKSYKDLTLLRRYT